MVQWLSPVQTEQVARARLAISYSLPKQFSDLVSDFLH